MSRLTGTDAYSLMEAYGAVYAPQELTEEQVWEEVETWVNSLLEEGYDLSDYTWEEMYESYFEEQGGQRGSGSSASQTNQSVSGKQVSNAINTGVQRTIGSTPVVAGARAIASGARYVAQQAQSASAVPSSGGPRNVRGGGQLRSTTVPSRPQPSFQNTGGFGRYGSPETQVKTPAAKPTAPAPAAARPAAPTARPAAPATPAARPSGGAPRPAATAPASLKVTPTKPTATATPTPSTSPARPSLSSQADEIRKMRAGSLARQGKTLEASTVSGTTKPAYQANSFDPFDVVKGHLIDEGYADTEEAALVIMANMSESWKNSIIG
jgi:hypothetical protein